MRSIVFVTLALLPAGEHTVLIEKRTETFVGTTRFMGLEAPGGALVPSPAPFSLGVELIGDSITCGYGNEGKDQNCSFTPDTENEYMAYGAIAARALNAAHTGISWSGIGMYRSYDGSTDDQMPVRFDLTLAEDLSSKWDFSWTPDVVVISLGTNDFAPGDPGQPYVDAYIGFTEKVRGHYPNAYILCAVGSVLGGDPRTKAIEYTQSVITARKAAGDMKIGFVDLGVQDLADGLGCDWHPNIVTNEKMAAKLVTGIKEAVGW
jgi:lysophospholipase L1-like esterase